MVCSPNIGVTWPTASTAPYWRQRAVPSADQTVWHYQGQHGEMQEEYDTPLSINVPNRVCTPRSVARTCPGFPPKPRYAPPAQLAVSGASQLSSMRLFECLNYHSPGEIGDWRVIANNCRADLLRGTQTLAAHTASTSTNSTFSTMLCGYLQFEFSKVPPCYNKMTQHPCLWQPPWQNRVSGCACQAAL
jgi:hypothetical protein